jgi:HlyD family secretion protein
MWTFRWFVLCSSALLASALFFLIYFMIGPSVVVHKIAKGNLIKSIVASGHFETPYRVEIGSQMTGVVEQVLVEEGQRVRAGEELIHLDDQEARASVIQAQGVLAQAQARMKQLKELTLPAAQEALSQAQATLIDAQNTFNRVETLFKNGSSTRAALDDAQKNLDIAQAQLRNAQLQVFTSSPEGSDYIMAQTQVNQALANVHAAESRLSYTVISAPRDGVLISRNVEKGTIAQPGRALLILAPDGVNQLVIDVDEKNLSFIQLGQKARASADAFPNDMFDATVSYINPSVNISRASIEVKLNIDTPPSFLRQDMTVSVDITAEEKDNILIIPLNCLYDSDTNQPWVLLLNNNRIEKRNIELGMKGASFAEVTAGLVEGDLIIPVSAGVRTGQHIRPIVQ